MGFMPQGFRVYQDVCEGTVNVAVRGHHERP